MAQSAPSPSTSALRLPPKRNLVPYVGDFPLLALAPKFVNDHYLRHGPIFQGRAFGRPCVVMIGPEACRFVLADGMEHFSWREGWPKNFTDLLGHGLFVQDGEEHRQNRLTLSPAFRGKALSSYVTTIERIALTHLDRWEKLRDMVWMPEMKKLTFEVAATLLLGVEDQSENERISKLFSDLVSGLFALPIPLPGSAHQRARKAREELRAYVERAIRERMKEPREDALGLLVSARDEDGKPLPLEGLKDQAILLAFAGHDTTTSMLTTLCLRLAEHPDVLERCRQEQDSLNLGPTLTFADLSKMPYLEQVLREIERLDPPVGGGFRGVIKPFSFGGYDVPKGWLCQYNIGLTHMDGGVWDDVGRFDPDRFSPERAEQKRKGFSLVGFGGGPRICLGMGFAQLEMKIIASHLLRGYSWELVPGQDTRIFPIPTAHPKDGLKVHFHRR